jgi:transcriptional regulator with XRE-family HTH domain
MERFGEKLRVLRKRRGMTQQELADALGFAARSYISSLESNEKEPSARLVLKISQLFAVSADQLLQDELEV